MGSFDALRSLQYSADCLACSPERSRLSLIGNRRSNIVSYSRSITPSRLSNGKRPNSQTYCVKAPDASLKSENGSLEKGDSAFMQSKTVPDIVQSLVQEVCDETKIAELKLKFGGFEVHLKRNIASSIAGISLSSVSQTPAPPSHSKPVESSTPPPPSSPKPSEKTNPFLNESYGKSPRLAALEASGTNAYVFVTSPMVGSFKNSRPAKGNKVQPPLVNVGDTIRKGAVVGYVLQFGRPSPVKSDVAGEVVELLAQNGEAVGYGDPVVAVLPTSGSANN